MLIPPAKLDAEPRWFCLRAAPKREHIAAAGLVCIPGVEVFAPRIRFRRDTRRGPVWFVESLFPGYLFARFSYPEQNRLVRHSRGVTGLLTFGESVATVGPDTIGQLRAVASDRETVTIEPPIGPGREVRVVEGPLRGLQAVVTQVLPAKQRVKILIEFLGSYQEAETSIERVIPTGHPRGWVRGG